VKCIEVNCKIIRAAQEARALLKANLVQLPRFQAQMATLLRRYGRPPLLVANWLRYSAGAVLFVGTALPLPVAVLSLCLSLSLSSNSCSSLPVVQSFVPLRVPSQARRGTCMRGGATYTTGCATYRSPSSTSGSGTSPHNTHTERERCQRNVLSLSGHRHLEQPLLDIYRTIRYDTTSFRVMTKEYPSPYVPVVSLSLSYI
jgi:hypothetical protein